MNPLCGCVCVCVCHSTGKMVADGFTSVRHTGMVKVGRFRTECCDGRGFTVHTKS